MVLDAVLALTLAGLAFFLRAISLPMRFPYNDDLMQLHIVTRSSWGAFGRALVELWPMPPPLDYLLGFLAARLTHDLQLLRLAPVCYGTLSVLVAYALGRSLHSRAFGWWWAFLLAVSMPLISYSQTLRPYSLTVLLTLCSCWAFHAMTVNGGSFRYAVTASAFQAAYPHAAIFAACQWAVTKPLRRLAVTRALVPSVLVFIAWLGSWRFFVRPGGTPHYGIGLEDIRLVASVFNQGTASAAAVYVPLSALGCLAAWRDRRSELSLALMLLACGFPAIVLLHALAGSSLAPRHAIALLPVYLALVAGGVTALSAALQERGSKRSPVAAALVAPILSTALFLVSAGPISKLFQRESFLTGALQEAVETLRRDGKPGEPVVFSNPNTGAAVLWALDPDSFFGKIEGIQMTDGFAHFRFPKVLEGRWGTSHPVFTLSPLSPSLATTDVATAVRTPGWWVSLNGINYIPDTTPFPDSVGLPRERISEPAPGVYRLAP